MSYINIFNKIAKILGQKIYKGFLLFLKFLKELGRVINLKQKSQAIYYNSLVNNFQFCFVSLDNNQSNFFSKLFLGLVILIFLCLDFKNKLSFQNEQFINFYFQNLDQKGESHKIDNLESKAVN
ncbi:hypothetical protein ABPG72_022180 [Tetrahymena utriculariae]